MNKFQLVKKSENRLVTKFQVLNDAGDIVGSIGVEPGQVADLLRHWSGPVEGSSSSKAQSQKQNPVVAAIMNAKSRVVNRQAILRSC